MKYIYYAIYLPPMSPPILRPSLYIDSITEGVKLHHNNHMMQYLPKKKPPLLSFLSIKWLIVRLLVATLHVGMTGKRDGGYTQLCGLTSTGLSSPGQNIVHSQWLELCMDDERLHINL